ncbi:hypothetical protein P3T18_003515 [Paraburkholderia sp. GAS199]|uniref:hypothetical protein n=1 Tax=Paraburkholderia sp. GAS199 TaxID=3035126 RepID=UPI003D1FB9D4
MEKQEFALRILVGVMGAFMLVLVVRLAEGTTDHFWNVLSGIGTFSAAVIALFFGLGQQVSANRIADDQAKLTAAILHPRLLAAQEAMTTLALTLNEHDTCNVESGSRMRWFDRCNSYARNAVFKVPLDELIALAPLTGDCAMNVARASALIDTIVQNLSGFNAELWTLSPDDVRAKVVTSISRRTADAVDVMASAIKICKTIIEGER